jgi:hypothetical protein
MPVPTANPKSGQEFKILIIPLKNPKAGIPVSLGNAAEWTI